MAADNGFEAFRRKKKERPETQVVNESGVVCRAGSKTEDRIRAPIRFTAKQWEKIKELAISDRTSIQQIAIAGIARIMAEKGTKDFQDL